MPAVVTLQGLEVERDVINQTKSVATLATLATFGLERTRVQGEGLANPVMIGCIRQRMDDREVLKLVKESWKESWW